MDSNGKPTKNATPVPQGPTINAETLQKVNTSALELDKCQLILKKEVKDGFTGERWDGVSYTGPRLAYPLYGSHLMGLQVRDGIGFHILGQDLHIPLYGSHLYKRWTEKQMVIDLFPKN